MTISVFSKNTPLLFATLLLVALAAGCGGGGGGGGDGSAAGIPAGAIVPGATCTAAAGALIPTITASDPTNGNQIVATSTTGVAGGGKLVTATFSLAMNAATITATSFTLTPAGGAAIAPASVSYNASTKLATLTTSSPLLVNTTYTAVITQAVMSAAGVPIGCAYAWTFKTAATASTAPSAINLGLASTFGLASRAGLSSTGVVVINGDVALWPTGTCTDATGTPANCAVKIKPPSAAGLTVNGSIWFAGDLDTPPGQTAMLVSNDLQTAWNEGFSKVATQPTIAADELGGKTFIPGVYANANLTLSAGLIATMDAQNDPDAIFIFKVGGVAPAGDFVDSGILGNTTEIKLVNGAQAKNIWFVIGRDATIGQGTKWNGNILAGRTFSINRDSRVLGRVLAGASGAGALTLTGAAAPSLTTVTVP